MKKEPETTTAEIDELVLQVNAAWQKAVSSIIETGKILLEYRDRIPHGQWEELFSHKLGRGRIPFSDSTTYRLMEIARNPVLSNPAHAQDLPPSWAQRNI